MYIFAGFTTFASGVAIYKVFHKYIRPRFSVKVNCWFCQRDHVVPYGNANCWDCPYCDQYNGFNPDGDYNKVIPSQHENLLNTGGNIDATNLQNGKSENGLCDKCNLNQLLKIKQLAAFVPCNHNTFDEEIKDFHRHVESVYKLCARCEEVLHRRLSSQNESLRARILSWKLERKPRDPNIEKGRLFSSRTSLCIKFLHALSLAIALALTLQAVVALTKDAGIEPTTLDAILAKDLVSSLGLLARHNYVIIGLFSILFSVLLAGKQRLRCIDAIGCFAWLVTLFASLPIFAHESVSAGNRLATHGLLSAISLLATFACVMLKYPQLYVETSWIGSRSSPERSSILSSSRSSDSFSAEEVLVGGKTSSSPLDTLRRSLLQDSCITTTCSSRNIVAQDARAPVAHNKGFDLDNDLQAMKIGTPRKHPSLSNIFATKSYDSPPRFPPPNSPCGARRQILTPANFKAKSLNKSSWVAGGYWASAPSGPYGSHSSESFLDRRSMWKFPGSSLGSKHLNSFYGSLNTSFSCPVSREGSTSGDDRLSVFSEPPTRTYRPPFQLSPSLLATIRDPSSDRENSVRRESENGESDKVDRLKDMDDECVTTEKDLATSAIKKGLAVLAKGACVRNVFLFSILGVSLIANSVFVGYLLGQYFPTGRANY